MAIEIKSWPLRFGALQLPPRLKRGQIEELTPAEVRELTAWLEKPVGAESSKSHRKGAKKNHVSHG